MKWIKYKSSDLLINLENVESIDKERHHGKDGIVFYAISGNYYGWIFNTEEERDKVLKRIEEIAIDINIKI